MREVFKVELASESGCAEITLPATPYAMLDALEQLRLAEGEAPGWEIIQSNAFPGVSLCLDRKGTLPELNALAQRLAQLDERELAIVAGLVELEHRPQDEQPVPLPRLIDLAYSTDCCHLVEGVVTDAQLGRFCAENGFVPEADDLPDAAFALLDFARIGKQFREAEGGVFTRVGYVQRHDELKQVYNTLDLALKKPDYVILAELEANDALTKYKAVLAATGCEEIALALTLADELDRYSFDPELLEPDEVAGGHLKGLLPEEELAALLPSVNLYRYGQALVEQSGGKLTGYGYVRQAVGPVQDMEPRTDGFEMELN